MKERVKTKGRPKRGSKQLTFNKTAADRDSNPSSKVRTKKSRKNIKEDFIEEGSDTETDISLKLDDDSDNDFEDEYGEEEDDFYDSSGEITFNNIVDAGRKRKKV